MLFAGAKYEFHYDSNVAVGRISTLLVYLNDVDNGGETVFPFARYYLNDSITEEPRKTMGAHRTHKAFSSCSNVL